MTRAKIVVDVSSLKPGSLGPATGSIWLDIDDVSFPMRGWNDFVVVVLGWWAAAALRVLRGDTGPHDINFMDGPHLVELSVDQAGTWRLGLVDTGRRRHVRSQHSARRRELVESIIYGSDSMLQACREAQYWSDDAATLENAVAALRKELPSH